MVVMVAITIPKWQVYIGLYFMALSFPHDHYHHSSAVPGACHLAIMPPTLLRAAAKVLPSRLFVGEVAKVVNEMSQSGFKGFCWDIKHDKTSRDWDTSYQWSSDILFS